MKKLVVLCTLIVGFCAALSPVMAGEIASLQVIDFPKADLMIVFADKDAAVEAPAHVDVKGCGEYSLVRLLDYSAGKAMVASMPWGHKSVSQDEWTQLEGWFKNAVMENSGKEGILSAVTPEGSFYSVDQGAAGAVAKAGTGEDVAAILESSKTPAVSKYILEEEHHSWWPPRAPEDEMIPTL
ncbi:hypothetical protein [Desulfatibacillum aliphaticivorans]|uniref:hypothetical protein n=1 Tax=Desulfatibacillum aliphaticivorans TaxID=218208 RepID=UPI0003FD3CAA|nr:hypothetical protein [Desulfatibacillum aliphaticivorans]